MKKSTFIIIVFVLGIIYLVVSTFLQMGKPIRNLFSTANKITENQYLTDSTFTLLDLNTYKTKTVDFNKNLILSFRGVKNITNFKDKEQINEFIEQKKELYIVLTDTMGLEEALKNKVQLYYIDTTDLPFKHKKLLYPYTIKIESKKIKKTTLGNLSEMIDDI